MSYADTLDKAKKDFGLGSGFFSIKDGESKKVRLISEAIPFQSPNKFSDDGGLRTQFLVYLIDRQDGVIKPYSMPVSVMNQIVDLQLSEDYGFEDEIPYDVTIIRKKEGAKTSYSVQAARQNTLLTAEEKEEIKKLKPLKQIIEKMEAKRERSEAPHDENQVVDENDPQYQEFLDSLEEK